jgi:hypothetical membrane protein
MTMLASRQKDRGSTTLSRPAVAASAAFGTFWLAVLVAAAVNPGYSHVAEFISALAGKHSRAPGIMMTGIAVLAMGTAVAGIDLVRRLRGISSVVAGALLTLAGGFGVVAAFAQQDCSTALEACQAQEVAGLMSGHHVVHELTALAAFVLAWLALVPLGWAVGRTPGWSRYRWPTFGAALVGLAMLVWLVVGDPGSVAGVVQRVFVLVVFGIPVLLVTQKHHDAVDDRG